MANQRPTCAALVVTFHHSSSGDWRELIGHTRSVCTPRSCKDSEGTHDFFVRPRVVRHSRIKTAGLNKPYDNSTPLCRVSDDTVYINVRTIMYADDTNLSNTQDVFAQYKNDVIFYLSRSPPSPI